jgi:2-polyprenyl-6-methoxyphenol hydroxylase-like FAD-dependent oxidoreductase
MSHQLQVLIVGASIAGPAFAAFLLLSPLRVHVTILERAPHVRPEGQNIDLRSVGIDAIRHLGLKETVRAHLTGERGVQWIDDNDRAIASIPASKAGERQGPTADIEMLRGTLARLVTERCEELGRENQNGSRVEFIYNDYIETLEQLGDSVQVTLANSKHQHTFDLVVGADGLQSRTRWQAFGVEGESGRVRKLGIYGGFFSMPRIANDSDWRQWYHTSGRRGVMIRPSDRPDRVTVFMHKKVGDAEEDRRFAALARGGYGRAAAQKDLMRETFSDVGWRQRGRLLRELVASEDFYYDMIAQVKMERWSKGRVVLIGDAAWVRT